MNTEKRGPGRPRVNPFAIETEENTVEPQVFVAEKSDERPAQRGVREAALRAEQIRARQRDNEGEITQYDEFYLDPTLIPEGWDYNWKRYTVLGQKEDSYDVELAQNGWEPVDASRHPHMMPIGYKGPIIRKEMILMERPAEISSSAKQRELYEARKAFADKEKALGMAPQGHFDRDQGRSGVRKSFEPMAIPKS
jgi:hypothetical protein